MINVKTTEEGIEVEGSGEPEEIFAEWAIIGIEISQKFMKELNLPKTFIILALTTAFEMILKEIGGKD